LGAAAAVTGLSLLAALPMLTPLPWPAFGEVNAKAVYALELSDRRGIGTTNDSEFLPVGVISKPRPNPAITAAVAAGTVVKVDPTVLPAGVQATLTKHNSLEDDFSLSASEAFVLPVLTFYWPGWTAYLDGQQVPIKVSEPDGFINVAVPAGTHTLVLRLEDTPARQLSWAVSAVALALLLGLMFVPVWGMVAATATAAPLASWPALAPRPALGLIGLALVALLLRLGWDASNTWHAAHDEPQVVGAQAQKFTRFDNGVALEAYDFPDTQARPGDKLHLTFYWEVTRPTDAEASVFVHFYGPNGALFGQADKPDPVLDRPTNRWALGMTRVDQEIAVLKPDAPAGVYTVAVGLWDRSTGKRSLLLDQNGQPTKTDKVILTTQFTVTQ
jgi:hypothetical protein